MKFWRHRSTAFKSILKFFQAFSPFTRNDHCLKAAAVDDLFIEKLIWTGSWYHYSPAYQWRGSTQRAPCRNKEAEEEASAFPPPCRDEPPTENTKSSARLTMSSIIPQTRHNSYYILPLHVQQLQSQLMTATFTAYISSRVLCWMFLFSYFAHICF